MHGFFVEVLTFVILWIGLLIELEPVEICRIKFCRYIPVGQIMQMILGNDFSDLEFEVKVKGQIKYFLLIFCISSSIINSSNYKFCRCCRGYRLTLHVTLTSRTG